jgi:hypothetical protein
LSSDIEFEHHRIKRHSFGFFSQIDSKHTIMNFNLVVIRLFNPGKHGRGKIYLVIFLDNALDPKRVGLYAKGINFKDFERS